MSKSRQLRSRSTAAAIAVGGCLILGLVAVPPAQAVSPVAPATGVLADGDESSTEIADAVPDLPPIGHPAREVTIEGEALAGRLVRADSTAKVGTGAQAGNLGFSADKRLVVSPAADGEHATFRVAAPAAGTYSLRLDVLQGPEFGTFDVAVNGEPVGERIDSYAEQPGLHRQLVVGDVDLTDGDNTITITGAGANDAAAGTDISIDLVHLVPLPAQTAIHPPGDSPVVKGTQRITVAGPHTDSLTVDGSPVAEPATTAGSGSVSLVFDSSDFQGRSFPNYAEINGVLILIPNTARTVNDSYTTTSVALPSALLTVGDNTIRIAAGGSDANCGVNFDDFRLRDVRLQTPAGSTVADADDVPDVLVGDGSCGSNQTIDKHQDYRFTLAEADLDPAGSGLAADLDTTALADGTHTIAVPGGTGDGAQQTVVVDNTAPVIEAVSFSSGELLKGTKTLTATATDATTEVELAATLDGEPVTIGDELDSDTIYLGSHELVITATDAANNVTTRTITFDAIPERPLLQGEGAPADGATGLATDPVLRSTWRDPTREKITVDFHAAELSAPSRVTRGEVAEIPDTVTVPGARRDSTRAVAELDGRMLKSPTSSENPVQTFELPVRGNTAGNIEVRWDGTIDAAREAVLWAYDLESERWQRLADGRGTADGSVLTLRGTVSDDFVDRGDPNRPVVHALVQGNDPFAADIADPVDEQFKDPADYTFAMSWMTDTQYLTNGATRPDGPNPDVFRDTFTAMAHWIADNADDRKIAYSAHTGDITEVWSGGDPTDPAKQEQSTREFEFASRTMGTIDGAGIPNGVIPGNHDNLAGISDEKFNAYFGADRYRALSDQADEPFYGENFGVDENDNSNHYDLFSRGGQDFVVLYLGYGVAEDETNWANEVLARYSDRNAILATHDYLVPSQQPDASDAEHTAEGQFIYNQVVSKNDNVFLVLAGHTHGMGLNIVKDVARKGHHVVEMLADRQFFEVDGQRRDGFLRLLQFDVERGELSVNTYSPYLDNHNSVEFDTQAGREYQDSVDEFTIPIDLDSRTTAFATDAVQLAVQAPGMIGTQTVETNTEASVEWAGLQPQTRYGWFTRATDSDTGVAVSPVFTFTTGDAGAERGTARRGGEITIPAPEPVRITAQP